MSNRRTFFYYVIPSVLSFALSGIYAIVDGFFCGQFHRGCRAFRNCICFEVRLACCSVRLRQSMRKS